VDQFTLVFLTIIPVYLIILVGGVLRKTGSLKPETDSGMMRVTVNILLPCLILNKIIGIPSISAPIVVFSSIGVGLGIVILSTVIAYFTGALFGLQKGTGKRTFGVSTGIQNYGYLAIPLVDSLFPNNGALAVLFVHNIGVEIALWTICLMMLSGDFSFSFKIFLKGPIIAVVLGLMINFSGLSPTVPQVFSTTLEMLGACALPIALLLIGTALYDLWGKEKINWPLCAGACLLRLILFPSLILLVAYLLPLSLSLKQVLLVQASLPAAMFPIVMAKHYNGQVGIAAQVVLSTTLVSIFTMPLIIVIGLKLLRL